MAVYKTSGGEVRYAPEKFIEKIKRQYKEKFSIAVGFPAGKVGSIQYPDGTPLIDVAVYNNYGTFNKDGTVHIPPRPFLDVGGLKAVEKTKALRIDLMRRVNEGQIPLEEAADIIGAKAASVVRLTIRNFSDPPNAESTIARKKSDNPLVDTGLLMKSVTWEIREKKNNRN